MDALLDKTIDNYEILEVIGQGGMGKVYKARDNKLDKIVVLKMIHHRFAEKGSFVKRFLQETKLQAKVDCPHIVKVFAFRESSYGSFIVMEYVDGMTLAEYLRNSGALYWKRALPIFKESLFAISKAHQLGIVHRDINPKNIMISREGHIKILDFGLARIHSLDNVSDTLTLAGTPKYLPPEQIKDFGKIDPRSDIYSLGITLYEMLVGQTPFQHAKTRYDILIAIVEETLKPPIYYNTMIPTALSDIVIKSLNKNPADRYQNITEFLVALTHFEKSYQAPDNQFSADMAEADSGETIDIATPVKKTERRSEDHSTSPDATTPSEETTSSLINSTFTIQDLKTPLMIIAVLIVVVSTVLVFHYRSTGEQAASAIDPKPFIKDSLAPQLGSSYPVEEDVVPIRSYGRLGIASSPPGAMVWLDGRNRGPTYFQDSLLAGVYTARIEKPGFQTWTQNISVNAGSDTLIHAILAPLSFSGVDLATLTLNVIPAGSIYIDEEKQLTDRNARLTVSVAAGKHRIRFVHPYYGTKEIVLDMKAGQEKNLTCYFEQYVSIQSLSELKKPQSALIQINGVSKDMWTPLDNYKLGVGTHTVSVKNVDYQMRGTEQVLTVVPTFKKVTHRLLFTLKKIEPTED